MKIKQIKIYCLLFAIALLFSDEFYSYAKEQETESSGEINEIHDQSGYSENSWRYSDGVHIGISLYTEENLYENAWGYENGHYVNTKGESISGALAKGIDVSSHNGQIDWERVKAESDIDYVIIRCGYGNDQTDQDDDWWSYNASECTRLGIPFGVYIYSYAMNTEEALSEAEHVLRLVEGYTLQLPIYLDLEDEKYTGTLSDGEIAEIAKVFCERIQNEGYNTGIYANLFWFRNRLVDPCFEQWDKWVAQYNSQCDYEGSYQMWQCTASGIVPGIDGAVDINFDYVDRGYKQIVLEPVYNLVARASGKSRITLNWDESAHADGYHIYRKVSGEEELTYYDSTEENEFVDGNAHDGKYNFYRVYPYYEDDNGIQIMGLSTRYVYTKPGLLPVEHISAQSCGKGRVNLFWQKVEGADGYIIYKAVGNGKFSYLYIKNTNTYIDNSASDTEYNFYRIYPYYNTEDNTRIVGASTKYAYAKGLLPPVTGLKARSDKGSVTVSWNKISDADGYIIYRQVGSEGKFTYRYIVSGTGFKDWTASDKEYNFYRIYPYHLRNGERIVNTQSTSYIYGKAK